MRVGLVLGAGGSVGAAWLIGALEALESETGWSAVGRRASSSAPPPAPSSARSPPQGLPPALMAAYAGGGALDDVAEAEQPGAAGRASASRRASSACSARCRRSGRARGAWRVNTLRAPHRHTPDGGPGRLAAARLRLHGADPPSSSERFVDGRLAARTTSYWAVAADYATGTPRRSSAATTRPPASVGDAVAASCAIPGFYHPVKIGGRRYIDGGVCSPSNLDLLCDEDLDLVVCLNPMSSLAQRHAARPRPTASPALMRAQAGRRLGREAKKLREGGTERAHPPADRRGPRGHGREPHGPRPPRGGHRARASAPPRATCAAPRTPRAASPCPRRRRAAPRRRRRAARAAQGRLSHLPISCSRPRGSELTAMRAVSKTVNPGSNPGSPVRAFGAPAAQARGRPANRSVRDAGGGGGGGGGGRRERCREGGEEVGGVDRGRGGGPVERHAAATPEVPQIARREPVERRPVVRNGRRLRRTSVSTPWPQSSSRPGERATDRHRRLDSPRSGLPIRSIDVLLEKFHARTSLGSDNVETPGRPASARRQRRIPRHGDDEAVVRERVPVSPDLPRPRRAAGIDNGVHASQREVGGG